MPPGTNFQASRDPDTDTKFGRDWMIIIVGDRRFGTASGNIVVKDTVEISDSIRLYRFESAATFARIKQLRLGLPLQIRPRLLKRR